MQFNFGPEVQCTSSAEKMDQIIRYLGIQDRVIDQDKRLSKLSSAMNEPAFVCDTWTQRTPDGERGAFGLATYLGIDRNDKLSLGMEFLWCKSIRKLERVLQQIKGTIDLPINLLASVERQEVLDREDGITDQSKRVIVRYLKK